MIFRVGRGSDLLDNRLLKRLGGRCLNNYYGFLSVRVLGYCPIEVSKVSKFSDSFLVDPTRNVCRPLRTLRLWQNVPCAGPPRCTTVHSKPENTYAYDFIAQKNLGLVFL